MTPLLHLDVSTKLVQNLKLIDALVGVGSEHMRRPRLPLVGAERERVQADYRRFADHEQRAERGAVTVARDGDDQGVELAGHRGTSPTRGREPSRTQAQRLDIVCDSPMHGPDTAGLVIWIIRSAT